MSDREMLAEIEQAFFHLPCGVVVASTSSEGEILLVNAEFTAITGYRQEDVPDVATWLGRAYPDDVYRAMVTGQWERDVTEPGRDVIYRVRCADGGDKELLLRAGLVGTARMVVAMVDLSEIRAAQRALREVEQRFELIADTVDQVFWIVGLDPVRMEYVSPAYDEIWGRPREGLYEDPGLWSAPILEEDAEAVETTWARALAGETTTIHFEYRVRRPDGGLRWIEDSGYAVRDEEGRVVRLVGIAKDISPRKQAEEARRALEQRMQAAQKTESLGVLAGGVAHDFNNLLMGVLGNADLALRDLPPGSSVRENLEGIRRTAHRAADLARQMLAYAGKGQLVLTRLDLRQLVEEFSDLMEAMVTRKALIRLVEDGPTAVVKGDATQIRQVVMNLITNASDAIGDGQGVITITTGSRSCDAAYLDEPHLDREREPGLYSFVEVADTGEGMDEETRVRIFDPFFTTRFTGRGLGLAAVLGIVHGHRGVIKVSSERGRGTVVRVLFPAVEGGVVSPEAEAIREEPDGPLAAARTVLVVDDEETVLEVVTEMLRRGGYGVTTADDGYAAVSTYRERGDDIDLVILDLAMPRMDGQETLRALRELDPGVRVVLTSGYGEQLVEPGRDGSLTFLQKPYTVNMLLAAVADALADEPD